MEDGGNFRPSDLPIIDGKVYHLRLKPEELAKNIIIVGDPERVPFITDEYFGTKEVDRFHRGLRTITGYVAETGQRVSIITSGMGTPSLEIVINEIVALNEIDFRTRTRKTEYDMITIIRVGTSGGLQQDTELGTLVITDYAVGLDNTGLFYDAPYYEGSLKILEERVREAVDGSVPHNSRFKGEIFPYASRAHCDVVKALEREAQRLGVKYKRGITVSNSGFFANQGRALSRVDLTVPEIDGVLSVVDTGIEGLKIENMEMEASFLLHFMGALGYRAGVICPVIDNRREEKFTAQYTQYVKNAAKIALNALNILQ
jgi:uridine phosphorylase